MTTFDITDAFLERLVQRGIVCMAWTQVYDPAGSVVLSALSAAIPLMVLFYMLAIRRAKGHVAAIVGLAVAFVLAVALWGMPFGTAVSSVAYGMANGLFPIVWIVITAVWVYNMTVESGEFEIIKDSLARLTDDRRLQALFIAFAFGAFLEGTAGFGTPVAITAAMLAGIGFNPLYAAGPCLIANTAPVAFGAIGVPVIVAGQVSGFDPHLISALVGRQPVGHIGAGCAGLALIAAQGLGHTDRIQFCRVQIFPIVGHDFQRHTGKVHPAEGIQVGGRVHNDLGFHTVHLQFYRSAADSPPGLFGFLWTSYQFFKNLSSNF